MCDFFYDRLFNVSSRQRFLSFFYLRSLNLGSQPGCAADKREGDGERESGSELLKGDGWGGGEEGSNGV